MKELWELVQYLITLLIVVDVGVMQPHGENTFQHQNLLEKNSRYFA